MLLLVDNLPRKSDGIQFVSLCHGGRDSRKRTLNSLSEKVSGIVGCPGAAGQGMKAD